MVESAIATLTIITRMEKNKAIQKQTHGKILECRLDSHKTSTATDFSKSL